VSGRPVPGKGASSIIRLTLALALAFSFTAVPADAATDLEKCRRYNGKIKMNYGECLELDNLLASSDPLTTEDNAALEGVAVDIILANASFYLAAQQAAVGCSSDLAVETKAVIGARWLIKSR